MDTLAVPDLADKLNYSGDISIGMGMDISIRGDGDGLGTKETGFEDDGGVWKSVMAEAGVKNGGGKGSLQFDNDMHGGIEYDGSNGGVGGGGGGKEGGSQEDQGSPHSDEVKNVKEVLYDPIDDVVVEDCCPEVCYRVCPCCIGDLDSPFWQLWYKHRLQVSRYA